MNKHLSLVAFVALSNAYASWAMIIPEAQSAFEKVRKTISASTIAKLNNKELEDGWKELNALTDADKMVSTADNLTLSSYAAKNGCFDAFEKLLQLGAIPCAAHLTLTIHAKNALRVPMLLKDGRFDRVINDADVSGVTPLGMLLTMGTSSIRLENEAWMEEKEAESLMLSQLLDIADIFIKKGATLSPGYSELLRKFEKRLTIAQDSYKEFLKRKKKKLEK